MTRTKLPGRIRRRICLALVGGAVLFAAFWLVSSFRPRWDRYTTGRAALDLDRQRLGVARTELLRLGTDGVEARREVLRREIVRREALAPREPAEAASARIRERFASLATRYGVHAPSFEAVPGQSAGGIRTEGFRVRAAGAYHDLGTWITEAVSDVRLIEVRQARLRAVPDSLTRAMAEAEGTAQPAAPAPATPGATPVEVAGAKPLDAMIEFTVHWYSLEDSAPAAQAGGAR